MRLKRLPPATILLTSVLAVVGLLGARARGAEPLTLHVALTTAADLTGAARLALLDEAESIWQEAGVRLEWRGAGEAVASNPAFRVVVSRRPLSPNPGDSWAVGELLRFENGEAIATASIARAEHVMHAAGSGRAQGLPDSVVQHRLGTVLGRAVAHEIGHYLLDSGAHASYGLMRARFQPREFTDLRSGIFSLDGASRRLVRARLLEGHQPRRASQPPTTPRIQAVDPALPTCTGCTHAIRPLLSMTFART
jgi:hypothetical protein